MKRETTKVKEGMGRNTTNFIKGKISRKTYLARDDKLHNRLFKELKK